MYYIVGLGNPGKEYVGTRHNIGFAALEAFAERAALPPFQQTQKYKGNTSTGKLEDEEVMLISPSTFMNKSGSAVAKLVPTKGAGRLIVVYDDIDLPLGEIKISYGRGDGGHNGVKSIIESLGTQDFIRIRVGIAQKSIWTGAQRRPKGEALAKFVLAQFSRSEQKELSNILKRVGEAVMLCVTEGKEKAMNQINERQRL